MPLRFTYSIGGVLFAALAGVLLLLSTGWAWWVCWLLAVNVVLFALYGWDKRRAGAGGGGNGVRIPELTLHVLAAGGGTPGAFAGQRTFRHKTRKRPFQVVFWLTVAAQVGLAAWILAGTPLP
ncbi:MAG: DUF1294 domain-containing protein [Actinomycetota bacterium]